VVGEEPRRKKQSKEKMKDTFLKLVIILMISNFYSLSLLGQDYLRISGSKKIYKYFPSAKYSDEKINDTVSVRIKKMNSKYEFVLLRNRLETSRCTFSSKKSTVTVLTSRTTARSKVIVRNVRVKILTPLQAGCTDAFASL
jgi:hypothetical protein